MTLSRGPAIVMYFVAALEGMLGIGFLSAGTAGVVPGSSTTFTIVGAVLTGGAVVLGYIGLRLARRAARNRELMEQGVTGTAQVLNARQTGVYLNDQPQMALTLRVTAPGHGTYDTTVKEVVPFIGLGRLGGPQPFTVKVDRQDRTRLLIDWDPVPTGMPAVPVPAADPAESARVKAQILATGIPGTARILSAEFAGSLDEQSRPVYSVQLHIQIDGRTPTAGPAVFAVPLERVSVMQPGGVIPIKADPYDPRKFAADWDRQPAG